jgi:hypothetical protein
VEGDVLIGNYADAAPAVVPLLQAARELGYGRTRAYQAVKEGWFPLPVIRRGERLFVARTAIDRYRAGLDSAEGPIVLREGPAK